MSNVIECFDGFEKYLKSQINTKMAFAYDKYVKQYRDYCLEMKLSMDESPEVSILKFLQSLLDEGNQCGTIKLYRKGIYYLYRLAQMEPNPTEDRFCMRIEDIAMQLSKREDKKIVSNLSCSSSSVCSDDIPGIQRSSNSPKSLIKPSMAVQASPKAPVSQSAIKFKHDKPFRVVELYRRFYEEFDQYCREQAMYSERYVGYLKLYRSFCLCHLKAETVTKDNINRFVASRFKSAEGLEYSAFKERLDDCFSRLVDFVGPSIDTVSPATSVVEYIEQRINPPSYRTPEQPDRAEFPLETQNKNPVTFQDSVEMEIKESTKYDSTVQTQEASATETVDYPIVIQDAATADCLESTEMPRTNKMPIIEDLPEHKEAPSVVISETPSARASESVTAEETVDMLKWKAINALIARGDIALAEVVIKGLNK